MPGDVTVNRRIEIPADLSLEVQALAVANKLDYPLAVVLLLRIACGYVREQQEFLQINNLGTVSLAREATRLSCSAGSKT